METKHGRCARTDLAFWHVTKKAQWCDALLSTLCVATSLLLL